MTDLSRRLTKLLGDDSHPVILFSLTLLANLCLQEKLGSKVMHHLIEQTVKKGHVFNLPGQSPEELMHYPWHRSRRWHLRWRWRPH